MRLVGQYDDASWVGFPGFLQTLGKYDNLKVALKTDVRKLIQFQDNAFKIFVVMRSKLEAFLESSHLILSTIFLRQCEFDW